MSKRRLKKNEHQLSGDAESPTKKIRTQDKDEKEFPAIWVYEENDQWIKYADDENNAISNAAIKKKNKKFSIPNMATELDFGKMIAKDKNTKETKGFRYCVKPDGDDSWYTWLWENDKKEKIAYPPSIVDVLESHCENKSTPSPITIGKHQYEVDITSMIKSNSETGNEYKIFREKIDVAEEVDSPVSDKDDVGERSKQKLKHTKSKKDSQTKKEKAGEKSKNDVANEQDDDKPISNKKLSKRRQNASKPPPNDLEGNEPESSDDDADASSKPQSKGKKTQANNDVETNSQPDSSEDFKTGTKSKQRNTRSNSKVKKTIKESKEHDKNAVNDSSEKTKAKAKAKSKSENSGELKRGRKAKEATEEDHDEDDAANGKASSKATAKSKRKAKETAEEKLDKDDSDVGHSEDDKVASKMKSKNSKAAKNKKQKVEDRIDHQDNPVENDKAKKAKSDSKATKSQSEKGKTGSKENNSDEEVATSKVKNATNTKSKGAKSSRTKAAKTKGDDEAENDENLKEKARTSKATSKATQGKQKKKQEVKYEAEEPVIKTVVIKTKAPVDSECPLSGKTHVYCTGDTVYDAMLNQTHVLNNNNKYYIVQVLEDDNLKSYHFWSRWGRVGKKGQNALQSFGSDIDGAIKAFEKKFQEKTKNSWENRHCFHKVPGKYDLLEMDYNTDDVIVPEEDKEVKKELVSKLHDRVRALIALISDRAAMEQTVVEMKYDSKKTPLGKLTKEQVKLGYLALKKIEDCIINNKAGQELISACNEFYTRIPHDFGMKRPPLINTKEDVQKEATLLEALGDIQVALTLLNEHQEGVHPSDSFYGSMNCQLDPLTLEDEEYKMIHEYMINTHAKTHSGYNLVLVDAFKCTRDEELERFKDYGNRKLLWHGSRLTNWASILKQGLRIAPPEAPVTGYMFGKGIYFADMSSKSANYCFATRSKNEGLLVLCEVSLGNCNELVEADYNAANLPNGKHSVHALGKCAPDPKYDKILPDGVCVPMGKGIETGVVNSNGYTLLYNEYIVYDVCQVKVRYLLRVRFSFK